MMQRLPYKKVVQKSTAKSYVDKMNKALDFVEKMRNFSDKERYIAEKLVARNRV